MVCLIKNESEISSTFEYTYLFQIEALFQNNTYWSYDYNLYSIVYNNSQIAVYDYQGVFLGVLNENTPGVQIIKEGSREFEQDSILYCKKSQIWNAGLKEGVIEWSINAQDGYEIKSFGLFKDLESGLVYLATEEYNIDGCNGTIYVLYVPLKNIIPTTIVGLFDYNYIVDSRNVQTLQYYFLNYPDAFNAFPLVNTGTGIPNTLSFLETYYNKGYRVFLLTALSTVIAGVLEWFNSHPDATGISTYSQASALSIPKSIYRLTPDNNLKFNLYANACILPYDIIYFIYDPNELINQSVLFNIEKIIQSTGKTLVLFPIPDPSSMTTQTINNIMAQIPVGENSSILVSMITYTNKFYNLFDSTTPYTNYPFYELFIYANITNEESQIYFKDKLFAVTGSQANLSTSYLWNVGYQEIGIDDYSYGALNSMIMAYQLEKGLLVNDLGEHADSIVFNQVTRDVVDVNIGISQYILTNGKYDFVPRSIYYSDNKGINYSSVVCNLNDPSVIEYHNPVNLDSYKTIALLELTGTEIDVNFQKTLYYYWTVSNEFSQFPIKDTGGSLMKTLELLDEYYLKGYRVFLGFTRSTLLKGVLEWFKSHPDCLGISPIARANELAVEKNIYRFGVKINYVLNSIYPELDDAVLNFGRIFYVYNQDEIVMQETRVILQERYGAENVLLFEVLPDDSNLTKENITEFFYSNGVNKHDVVVVYMRPLETNQYVSFFDSSLDIPCMQYDIQAVAIPYIDSATTSLKGKYNIAQITNLTSSYLYIRGQDYLQTSFFATALNILYFITQIQQNYNINYIYSYNSSLMFDKNNDIKFGTVQISLYEGEDIYNIVKVYTDDPLYGQLNFTPLT